MTGASLWLSLLGVEIGLVLLLVLVASWVRGLLAARRDRAAIATLIERVTSAKAQRAQQLEQFLVERMGLAGEALEVRKAALLRGELYLLQRFANTYRRRDAGNAALFDLVVNDGIAPYLELQAGEYAGAATSTDEAVVDTGEIEILRAENEHLKGELQITMDTMSRMLMEYSGMFAEAAAADSGATTAVDSAVSAAIVTSSTVEAEADDVMAIDDVVTADADADADADDVIVIDDVVTADADADIFAIDGFGPVADDEIDTLFENDDRVDGEAEVAEVAMRVMDENAPDSDHSATILAELDMDSDALDMQLETADIEMDGLLDLHETGPDGDERDLVGDLDSLFDSDDDFDLDKPTNHRHSDKAAK